MSRCEKHIAERPLAVVPAFDVLSGPGELAVIRITGVTAIDNKETIRTKAKLAGKLLFGRIKGSGRFSGVAVSRRCTVLPPDTYTYFVVGSVGEGQMLDMTTAFLHVSAPYNSIGLKQGRK